jgi:hypothetical protein
MAMSRTLHANPTSLLRSRAIGEAKYHLAMEIPHWPCMRLVGEVASKGKCPVYQKRQAITYLYYILLARPDLHVAQGLFTSDSGVMFLFGIGGVGVRTFSVPWNSDELYKTLYAFIYRLYYPGDFVDPSYMEMVPDLKRNTVAYTAN